MPWGPVLIEVLRRNTAVRVISNLPSSPKKPPGTDKNACNHESFRQASQEVEKSSSIILGPDEHPSG